MSLDKVIGIVVDSKSIQDIDRVITVLGESGEKHSLILKGIKKSKTRPIVSTEIGSLVDINFYNHKNRDINHIKEIHIVERFENLKSIYHGFLSIHAFCEITNKLTPPGNDYKNIYDLLKAALYALNTNGFQIISIPYFKIKLLYSLGLISKEFICIRCEEDIFTKSSAYINSYNFDIFCGDCHQEKNRIEILKLMKAMFQKNYSILLKEDIPPSIQSELDSILNSYIRNSLNIEFKSLDILYQTIGANFSNTPA
ncbi:MAG: DNA repair protein RecO [Leptospiraceae bacterium]|nr:DNA repair protein RecO [Leptospiraceae bacterium]